MKNRFLQIAIFITIILCLGGCNKSDAEKELADFSAAISDFTAVIKNADEQINAIDTTSTDASAELLEILDQLDVEFQNLTKLSVPAQYKSIETLAGDASSYMTNAVSYYHKAYESENFSEQDASIAYQYYTKAMDRIQYIGYTLVGEFPENENVTIVEETLENELFDKLLHRNEETIEGVPNENDTMEILELE